MSFITQQRILNLIAIAHRPAETVLHTLITLNAITQPTYLPSCVSEKCITSAPELFCKLLEHLQLKETKVSIGFFFDAGNDSTTLRDMFAK